MMSFKNQERKNTARRAGVSPVQSEANAEPPLPLVTRVVPRLAPRAPALHKGQAGRVALIAGSRGMSGAAVLCALGALRGGAGLVRVFTPASAQPILAAAEPCAMSAALPEDAAGRLAAAGLPELLNGLEWADAAAIGPGLGQTAETQQIVTTVLREFRKPLVLDADALNVLAGVPSWWLLRGNSAALPATLLTPHPGEMERLQHGAGLKTQTARENNKTQSAGKGNKARSASEDRRAARGEPSQPSDIQRLTPAAAFARHTHFTLILKGHRTVVCTPDAAYFNSTGNPGMATGGMGDVLTGLLAALLGQGLPAFDAARLAVFAHGAAADALVQKIGPFGYLAREVADALPAALAKRLAR